MCPAIYQKILLFPKVLWEHHSIQYFLHTIFFSVTVLGPGRYPSENLILYHQRSSSMIFWKRGNFGQSKLLWAQNGLNFIIDDGHEEDRIEEKNYANIIHNLLYFRLKDTSTSIGSTKFLTKVLWVYSHLKSDFFFRRKSH